MFIEPLLDLSGVSGWVGRLLKALEVFSFFETLQHIIEPGLQICLHEGAEVPTHHRETHES